MRLTGNKTFDIGGTTRSVQIKLMYRFGMDSNRWRLQPGATFECNAIYTFRKSEKLQYFRMLFLAVLFYMDTINNLLSKVVNYLKFS